MLEWWNSLSLAVQIFYCIAIPSTLIIVIQTILLAIGLGHGGEGVDFSDTSGLDCGCDVHTPDIHTPDFDANGHHIDFTDGGNPADFSVAQLFTLQGIMTFLCVFGWAGVLMVGGGLHIGIAIPIAAVLGFGAMFGVAQILRLSRKLQQNGNLDLKKLLGEKGTVYLPIPAENKGEGKVTVSTYERSAELTAVTDEEELIPTGTRIRVIDVRGEILVVEKDI